MSKVIVLSGSYRNQPVINQEFVLLKGYSTGKKGNYITVRNDGQFDIGIAAVKVKVDSIDQVRFINGDVVLNDNPVQESVAEVVPQESDEDAMNRISKRFAILDEMAKACINGDIRSMIVAGPPGVGKSFGVSKQLECYSAFDIIASRKIRYEIVKGTMSAIGLFTTLYKYSDHKNVLVFDDCDIWEDQDAINILKGALDSGRTRRISYNKDSRLLREEGVPNTFNFHGSVIFITNKSFENRRASKIQPHLEALQSRSHFLDLTINTERDKMIRIKQVYRDADPGLFVDYGFTQDQEKMILDFMQENQSRLREISLRMVLKIADLVKVNPSSWQELAYATCVK